MLVGVVLRDLAMRLLENDVGLRRLEWLIPLLCCGAGFILSSWYLLSYLRPS